MKRIILAFLALLPAFAFAQDFGPLETITTGLGNVVDLALPIVFTLGLLVFFWGLVKYIFAQGNEESKADGKKIMLWGLIAIFVMATVWGLVRFIGTTLGVENVQNVNVPGVNP